MCTNCWQIQEFPKGSNNNISNMFTHLLRQLTLDCPSGGISIT